MSKSVVQAQGFVRLDRKSNATLSLVIFVLSVMLSQPDSMAQPKTLLSAVPRVSNGHAFSVRPSIPQNSVEEGGR